MPRVALEPGSVAPGCRVAVVAAALPALQGCRREARQAGAVIPWGGPLASLRCLRCLRAAAHTLHTHSPQARRAVAVPRRLSGPPEQVAGWAAMCMCSAAAASSCAGEGALGRPGTVYGRKPPGPYALEGSGAPGSIGCGVDAGGATHGGGTGGTATGTWGSIPPPGAARRRVTASVAAARLAKKLAVDGARARAAGASRTSPITARAAVTKAAGSAGGLSPRLWRIAMEGSTAPRP